MRKVISVFMILIFNCNLYANNSYEYLAKENLTLSDIFYIQSLTEYSEFGSKYYYAVTPLEGFDVNKLSENDKELLISSLDNSGIFVNRDSFKDNGKYIKKLQNEIRQLKDAQKYYSRVSYEEQSRLSNLDTLDWVELTYNTGLNFVGIYLDVRGAGIIGKMSRFQHILSKSSYLKKIKFLKNANKYGKLGKSLEFFNSTAMIFLTNLANQGFVLTNQMKTQMDGDKVLQSELKGLGISFGKVAAGKLSDSVISSVGKTYVGKSFEAVSILFSNVVSAILTGDSDGKKILIDILKDLRGIMPVVGPMYAQYDKTLEIWTRLKEKPEAIEAWKNYIKISNEITIKLRELNRQDLSARLKVIIDYANNQDIYAFSDIPRSHRKYITIATLKKLNILKSKGKYPEYKPNDIATVSDVLSTLAKTKFPELRNKDNIEDIKIFLEKKSIIIGIDSEKLLNEDLNKNAKRGYVAKIITNIDIYTSNENSKDMCVEADDVDGYLRILSIPCAQSSSTKAREQILKCKKGNSISDWDECSLHLRFMNYTHRVNSFEPNKNVTRYELALFAYSFLKGVSNTTPKYYKLNKDVK